MDNVSVGVIGALAGATITACAALLNSTFQRKHDRRALIIKAAFELAATEWRSHFEASLDNGKKVYPLDVYVARAIELAAMLEQGNASSEKIASLNKRTDELALALDANFELRDRLHKAHEAAKRR
ncbi:hypothetical protein K7N18_35995 [Burkholderia arboris]|uniref:hypothetical protein n=1 Tax=Burkholderia arboris TaxID=488730 RepID=UPI001CA3DB94|nr:hypothetical protein [Burkholderia arboris]MBY8610227.1 hypothetical protein [Burkholderia arboris]